MSSATQRNVNTCGGESFQFVGTNGEPLGLGFGPLPPLGAVIERGIEIEDEAEVKVATTVWRVDEIRLRYLMTVSENGLFQVDATVRLEEVYDV